MFSFLVSVYLPTSLTEQWAAWKQRSCFGWDISGRKMYVYKMDARKGGKVGGRREERRRRERWAMKFYTWRDGSNSISFQIIHLYFILKFFFKDSFTIHSVRPMVLHTQTYLLNTKVLPLSNHNFLVPSEGIVYSTKVFDDSGKLLEAYLIAIIKVLNVYIFTLPIVL